MFHVIVTVEVTTVTYVHKQLPFLLFINHRELVYYLEELLQFILKSFVANKLKSIMMVIKLLIYDGITVKTIKA